MKKGFPKTTSAILAGLMAGCVLFGILMMKDEDRSIFIGFLLVPSLAFDRVAPGWISPVAIALFFWIGAGVGAWLSWSKKQLIFPLILALYSSCTLLAAWQQARALWRS